MIEASVSRATTSVGLLAKRAPWTGVPRSVRANTLAEIMVAMGLAQNLAAIWALASEGIQRGHMRLHARQVALAAGAQGAQVQEIANQLAAEGNINEQRARELIVGNRK